MNYMNILAAVLIVGGIGLLFGCLLAFAAVIFKVVQDERIDQITDILPGANCGACGYAGCSAYASAIVNDGAPIQSCPVGKDPVAQKIGEIMGKTAEKIEPTVARVMCGGTCSVASDKYEYHGVESCVAAAKLAGGAKSCPNGCLGLGTCQAACPFDAISMADGVAVIDEEKCTACGQCAKKCPKGIIRVMPKKSKAWVQCANTEKGALTNKYCKIGCIGCKMCEKACPTNAIKVENNCAVIDYALCIDCGACVEKCPKHAIAWQGEMMNAKA